MRVGKERGKARTIPSTFSLPPYSRGVIRRGPSRLPSSPSPLLPLPLPSPHSKINLGEPSLAPIAQRRRAVPPSPSLGEDADGGAIIRGAGWPESFNTASKLKTACLQILLTERSPALRRLPTRRNKKEKDMERDH